MNDLAISELTRSQIEAFTAAPVHALMLTGPTGSGKRTLAVRLGENLLDLPAGGFEDHPYTLALGPEEAGKAIGIEAVRRLERFTNLKVPGKAAHDRVIIIEDAHLLSLEAQNALLKTLEEPPAGTVLILTVNHARSVLPTIRSRAQAIQVGRIDKTVLESFFQDQGADAAITRQAYAISGGLPGLMHALVHDSDHPLMEATERARQLLSQSAYERLTTVDELAKQKNLAIDITMILQQMAHMGLQNSTGQTAQKWQSVLQAAYQAGEALATNAQAKLVLTKLMLSL